MSANPSLIFLDRFVSDLSGSEALLLTIQLRKLASEGRTVVCNLVDPRQEVLELFDTMLLLTGGRPAFFGNLDSFHRFANRHDCGIPRTMNMATFLAKQTIEARVNSTGYRGPTGAMRPEFQRRQSSTPWRRSTPARCTPARVARSQSETDDRLSSKDGAASAPATPFTSGRRESKASRFSERRPSVTGQAPVTSSPADSVLTKLADAYELSPEAYENNSIVSAVIDGTLQDMPRAPDLFVRNRSSFPNPTWTQVVILLQRHHAATLWEPHFYYNIGIIAAMFFVCGIHYSGQAVYSETYGVLCSSP